MFEISEESHNVFIRETLFVSNVNSTFTTRCFSYRLQNPRDICDIGEQNMFKVIL